MTESEMADDKRAILGDREATRRLTEDGGLLPCPFCGGAAIVEYDEIIPSEYSVYCGDCGVMPSLSKDEQGACLLWNTRVTSLRAKIVKRLEAQR